ncbi:MAG: class I SAM-dependent methyltransferase [Candidatus Magnetomorum sp.]|nr:class I SAM-dependent methyltransferase [Candidatus Magnetomorum sp.]
MSFQVHTDWWKNIFDELYLETDARSIGNSELTRFEIDQIEKAFCLDKTSVILDLCGGQGRHALELSRRGFQKITVLDYSPILIQKGSEQAKKEHLNVQFIQSDARKTCLRSGCFDMVLIMGSSFGYFEKNAHNIQILKESLRMLCKEGSLLLDLPDKDYVLNSFKPVSKHQATEDMWVRRDRQLTDDIIFCQEHIYSEKKGSLRNNCYCTRLYSPEQITQLLDQAGFSEISIWDHFVQRDNEGDFGSMTNRMLVEARK